MPPGRLTAAIASLATSMLAGEPGVGPVTAAIVSSGRVADFALVEARDLVRLMIGHRPELLRAIRGSRVRFAVMAPEPCEIRSGKRTVTEEIGLNGRCCARTHALAASPLAPFSWRIE